MEDADEQRQKDGAETKAESIFILQRGVVSRIVPVSVNLLRNESQVYAGCVLWHMYAVANQVLACDRGGDYTH